ncbi:KGK domain-containing protein [Myxosarcina sp. GI1]|uniref:KGK domain-containing protein n=1 Tax=Myxosarcina sp. GI1 TaxID=1541065 RepID=UPI00068C4B15|nr:KGK domain-containing protein [Myxosarcina sp. GI1]
MTEDRFELLEHEDVYSDSVICFENETTFKISKLLEKLNNLLINLILNGLPDILLKTGLGKPPHYGSNWNKGVKAEILEAKTGEWKKGKVRLRVVLEFCPDELEEPEKLSLESPLDDIRQNTVKAS